MTRRTFLAATPLAAQQNRFAALETRLPELMREHQIPGLSAVILKDQRVAWTIGFGFQDREHRVPATPDTPYRIASLTKTFASTLLLQLLEQGKLNLDEPMGKYAPNGSRWDGVRIRHVFTHTSEGTPGERYRYNGARFGALTDVIERLSSTPFRDLLARNILDKLGMARSVPGQDTEEPRYQAALRELAKPYKRDDSGEAVPSEYPPRRITASAGLISTANDLAKYDVAIDRHEFVARKTQEIAWTPALSNDGQTLPYGLGWFIQRHAGTRLVWHYGYWPGSFSSLLLKAPEKNTTAILLANSDGLSRPFPSLGGGNVLGSAFARLLLDTLGV